MRKASVREFHIHTSELVREAAEGGVDPSDRGATWTYLTTDQPFGTATERIMRGIARKIRSKSVWG